MNQMKILTFKTNNGELKQGDTVPLEQINGKFWYSVEVDQNKITCIRADGYIETEDGVDYTIFQPKGITFLGDISYIPTEEYLINIPENWDVIKYDEEFESKIPHNQGGYIYNNGYIFSYTTSGGRVIYSPKTRIWHSDDDRIIPLREKYFSKLWDELKSYEVVGAYYYDEKNDFKIKYAHVHNI